MVSAEMVVLRSKVAVIGAIVALAKAPALRALTVTPGDGEFPLAELGRLEHLRYLWIRDRDLTQPELRSLQTALPACRILQGPHFRSGPRKRGISNRA